MLLSNVFVQIWGLFWSVVTQVATKWLFICMNSDMPIQLWHHLVAYWTFAFDPGCRKFALKQLHFRRILFQLLIFFYKYYSIMFFSNVCVQIWGLVWSIIAHVASIWFFVIMNPEMPIQFWHHLEADWTFPWFSGFIIKIEPRHKVVLKQFTVQANFIVKFSQTLCNDL